MQRKYRLLREAANREGMDSFAALAADPSFRDFVCLYIAEGYKRDRNCVAIANSDASVLRLAVRWIRRLTTGRPEFSIQYHADQDLRELEAFWNRALTIGSAGIRFQRKSNSGQLSGRQWRCAHRVLTVRVGDTLLRARLQAWMDRLKESWSTPDHNVGSDYTRLDGA